MTNEDRTREQAMRLFLCSHSRKADSLIRENCGACSLKGYGEFHNEATGYLQPNYAGWQRAYVQAGRSIPRRWSEAFLSAAGSESTYGRAIAADVKAFGMRVAVA